MSDPSAPALSDELREIAHFNRLICQSRLRACAGFAVLVVVQQALDITGIRTLPVLSFCALAAALSWLMLHYDPFRIAPWRLFYVQLIFDLAVVTLGIGFAAQGYTALLLRGIFLLLIIPPSLVSVAAGVVATSAAVLAHEVLLGLESGFTWATLVSLESILPVFSFFVVTQQCFFYANYLKEKNQKLARLASRLTTSQRRLGGLVRVAKTLNSTLEADALLSRLNSAALTELRADWAGTFTVDWLSRNFRIAAVSEERIPFSSEADTAFPFAAWPVLERLANERIIAFPGAEVRSPALAQGRSIERFLSAGLYRDETLIGFLAIGYCAENDEEPNAAFEQLGAIAESATMALRNSLLLDEARQASRLKSDFVSTMSHELRTPLNVIIGYSEMLRDGAAGALSAAQSDLFEKIDAQARDLYDLIEATLQVGRMETGRDETCRNQIPIADLLISLQGVTAQLPRSATVESEWRVSGHLSGMFYSDLGKVNLILRNLVSNAFKFTSHGHVAVTIAANDRDLVLEVSDTGIGIPPESRQTMFEMFRQLDGGTTRAHGGVGLGLYIVKQMVERLGGSIDVQSTVGQGTTFRVSLPGYHPDLGAERGAA